MEFRHDWTIEEVREIYDLRLLDLVYRASTVHRAAFGEHNVQLCSLLSIKTGGCAEDCGYCSQSARHHASVKAEPLLDAKRELTLKDEVVEDILIEVPGRWVGVVVEVEG